MITKQCPKCGNSFKFFPSANKKYCSKRCYESMPKEWLYGNKHRKGKSSWNKGLKNWMSKEGKERMIASKIGKPSHRKGKHHTKEAKLKISLSQLGKTGKNSRAWKGGRSKIDRLCRGMIKYKEWRNTIFTRDNWTCQECGKNRIYITAHHKKSLCKIIKENSITSTSLAKKCLELWDLNNGITLCEECHSKTDNYRIRVNKKPLL